MKIAEKNELAKAAESFLNSLTDRGLGSYSGSELELLVLDFVLNAYPELSDLDPFDQSRALKVSEVKIKRLLYELKLRAEDSADQLIEEIERNLKSAEFEKGKFVLEVSDLYSQKKMKSLLKKAGHLTDSSFNKELMKVPFDGFVDVFSKFYPDKKSSGQFKDLVHTKKLASSNRAALQSISFPVTGISACSVWDLMTAVSGSLRARLEATTKATKDAV